MVGLFHELASVMTGYRLTEAQVDIDLQKGFLNSEAFLSLCFLLSYQRRAPPPSSPLKLGTLPHFTSPHPIYFALGSVSPPKPKPTAVEGNPWARRGGSSAAAAAIKAALGKGGDGESKAGMSAGVASGANTAAAPPAPKPKPAEPIWVAPRRGAETNGAEQETTRSATKVEAAEAAAAPAPAPEAVIDAVKLSATAGEEAESKGVGGTPENDGVEKAEALTEPAPEATPKPSARPTEAETALPPALTDKEALVQQFGKKKACTKVIVLIPVTK